MFIRLQETSVLQVEQVYMGRALEGSISSLARQVEEVAGKLMRLMDKNC